MTKPPRGFYLVSDFHVDMNLLANPHFVEGSILHEPKAVRVVKQIYNWLSVQPDRILAFVGDTSNSADASGWVWREAAERVRRVLAIAGNHDYYFPRYKNLTECDNRMDWVARVGPIKNADNISVLRPGREYLEDGVLYLGCTGWYNWDAVPELDMREEREVWLNNSNDARYPVFDSAWPDVLARRHADWLIEAVTKAQDREEVEKIVILTHTIPRADLCAPPTYKWYHLNGSYANTFMGEVLPTDIKKKVKVWAYGHTHFGGDQVIDGIRYVNNARGYSGESHAQKFWKPKWIGLD